MAAAALQAEFSLECLTL